MKPKPLFDQEPSEIVAVKNWLLDDEFPIFPTGQKPKRALICPAPVPHRFLIGGHRYLFKEPEGYHAQQIWSEVLAYRLSRRLPVEVPPAFLAYDERQRRSGVLVEFFFGYDGRPEPRFVHASDLFQARGMGFDTSRGSLRDNMDLSRLHGVPGYWQWWARTIAFDTLIGNTDRHSQNWGFLVDRTTGGAAAHSLAPAFDNGSSLGWLTREADIPKAMGQQAFSRFIARGRHNCTWTAVHDDVTRGHDRLAALFIKHRPAAAASMEPFALLSDTDLETVLQECLCCVDFPVAFTAQRADFVRAQVIARRAALRQCLGG